jgi:hypothetical protein
MLQGDFLLLPLFKFDFFNKNKVFEMDPNQGNGKECCKEISCHYSYLNLIFSTKIRFLTWVQIMVKF